MAKAATQDYSFNEVALRLRQQVLVADLGRFALRAGDLQTVLDHACDLAAQGLEARFAKVLRFDVQQGNFLVVSGVGWKPGVVGRARLGADLESPAGFAFKSGEPVVSRDLPNELRFRRPSLLTDHGVRSAINVLISASPDSPYGVLEVDSTNREMFSEHDVAFLQGLANTLADAVDAQNRNVALNELLADFQRAAQANAALLEEKDLLTREVHHRVMNSLQLVQSMLAMQIKLAADPDTKLHLREAIKRILAVAAVHQQLHQAGSVTSADISVYLRGLLDSMSSLDPERTQGRTIDLECEAFTLPADDVAPLGLIVVELITNALKHGKGRIMLKVLGKTAGLDVSVQDEGPGFAADHDLSASRGLGMRLIAGLSKQPDAIAIDQTGVSRITVSTGLGGSTPVGSLG